MRFKRVDSARLLVATEPNSNADKGTSSLLGALLHLLELASNVRKVLRDLTSLSLDWCRVSGTQPSPSHIITILFNQPSPNYP